MYNCLAKYYDLLMNDIDYDKWIKLVAGFINAKTNPVKKNGVFGSGCPTDFSDSKNSAAIIKGADLACGTGAFTIGLARLGYQVFGVDNSPQMLQIASDKAKQSGLKIDFIQQDINTFTSPSQLDFVTCMCDGINYLKNPKRLFASVASSLKFGGVFIFDISTEYKLTTVLANNTFTDEQNGVVYIWQNILKPNKVDISLTFFEKCGENYIRFDETQTQYIHKTDYLLQLLKLDFDVKICGELANKPPKTNENRIHFVATKRFE